MQKQYSEITEIELKSAQYGLSLSQECKMGRDTRPTLVAGGDARTTGNFGTFFYLEVLIHFVK